MPVPATEELLHDARAGSPNALNDVFRHVAPRLLRIIRLRLGPALRAQVESQDILQVTLLKAFRSLESFAGSGSSSLMGWLAVIAANEVRDQADFYRRQRRDAALRLPLDDVQPWLAAQVRSEVSRLDLKERERQLEVALERLRPEHREVILLRKFEELSFPEIAERMGRTPDACRMLLARAMTALVRELDGQDPAL